MRQKYCEAEAEIKYKQALKGRQPDNVQMKSLSSGEIVQYHRDGTKEQSGWRGPARVIGIDGQNVIIKHGGKIINAHPKDVRKNSKSLEARRSMGSWSRQENDEK